MEKNIDLENILLDDIWDSKANLKDIAKMVVGAEFHGRYVVENIIERTYEFLHLLVRDIYSEEEGWIKFYRKVPGRLSDGELMATHDRALYECYLLSALSASTSVACAPILRSFAAPPTHVAYVVTGASKGHRISEELSAPMSIFRQAVLGGAILAALTQAWTQKVMVGDLRPENLLVVGDPLEGKKSWIPVTKTIKDIRIKVISWRLGDIADMPDRLHRCAEMPVVQKALESTEHRQWAKVRIKDQQTLWNFQSKEAILSTLEYKVPPLSHEDDTCMASSTLALLAACPSATASSSKAPFASADIKGNSPFHAAAERWITAGLPADTPLYLSMLEEARVLQPKPVEESPFRHVLSQKWESSAQLSEAWHEAVPYNDLPAHFLSSVPLTPTTWLLDPSESAWTSAHFWRILDVLESPKGEDVRQLCLPDNAFGRKLGESLRMALHDLGVLTRRRKMTVMWRNINLVAADVRFVGDLPESVAMLISQGSAAFTVQGAIKCPSKFAKALDSRSTLLTLDLSDCLLFDDGCAILALALTPTLQHLNLTKNGLTCVAASTLATQVVPSLQTLSLCQNTIGSNGALALSLAIAKAPALRALDLSNNCITSALVYMGRAIAKEGCSLRELRVAENGLTSQDGRQFAECLHTMPPTHLRLEFSVNALGRSCYELLSVCVKKQFTGIMGLACNGAPMNESVDKCVRVVERPAGGAFSWPWPPEEYQETDLVCWL